MKQDGELTLASRTQTESTGALGDVPQADLAQRVQAERVRLLYSSNAALIAHPIGAMLAAGVLSFDRPSLWLIVWVIAMALLSLARTSLGSAYQCAEDRDAHAARWARRHAWGAFAAGCLWSVFMLAAMGDRGPVGVPDLIHVLLGFLIVGMTAAALTVSSVYLPSFHAFAVPANLSLAWMFANYGAAEHLMMATLALMYLLMVLAVARNWSRTIGESIELLLTNVSLVDELRDARDRAEQASRFKSDFLATMSHEFRTPLNAIIGFSETMKGGLLGPLGDTRYEAYVADIHDSGRHLLSLVNDILDLARIEAGKFELSEDVVSLREVVEQSMRLVHGVAEAGSLTLQVDLAEAPETIYGDHRALKQVLLNLLSNAVKFTPAGGSVLVRARRHAQGGVTIEVVDTGIGMSEDYLRRAKRPFEQARAPTIGGPPGSGLGLALSEGLIELHGGSLTLASEPGRGTTASVHLPASRVVAGVDAASPADSAEADQVGAVAAASV